MRLQFAAGFRKDLKRYHAIAPQVEARCRELVASETAAEQLGEPTRRELAGCRKVTVAGNYRMVYAVRGKEVWVIAVGPRQNEKVYEVAVRRLPEIPSAESDGGGHS